MAQTTRQTNFATGASQHTMGTGVWINNGNGTSTMVPTTASPSMPPGEAQSRDEACTCAGGSAQFDHHHLLPTALQPADRQGPSPPREWGQTLKEAYQIRSAADAGMSQAVLNGLNSVTDGLILTGCDASLKGGMLGNVVEVSPPQWARNRIAYQTDTEYELSKNLVGFGGTVLAGAGLAKLAANAEGAAPVAKLARGRAGSGPGIRIATQEEIADEAASILDNAAKSRGLTPGSNISAAKRAQLVDINKLIPPESRPFADPGKLARHGPFDWSKYQPIWVESDGKCLRVMDGMTRIENARRAGITQLPALVFPR